jgi:hypothetical protein
VRPAVSIDAAPRYSIVNPLDVVGQWLATVNEQLGTAFELTESGACGIDYENGATLFVQVLPEEESLVLYSPVASLDVRLGTLYLLGVLALNLFNRFTGPGVVGYDAERHALVYSERIDIGTSNALALASRLDQFPIVRSRLLEALSEIETRAIAPSDANGGEEHLPSPMDPRFLKP